MIITKEIIINGEEGSNQLNGDIKGIIITFNLIKEKEKLMRN